MKTFHQWLENQQVNIIEGLNSSVLTDAVAAWKGDPSILRDHVQNEIDGKPLPSDAGKRLKNLREMAKALLKAVREKSEPAPTLYRGDKIKSFENTSPLLGWTSSKRIAEQFASENGGEVEVLDNVKGLNLSKFTDADLERGEDEWIVENHRGGVGHRSPERAVKLGNYLAKKSQEGWEKEPTGYYTNSMISRSGGNKTHKLFQNYKKGREIGDIGRNAYKKRPNIFLKPPNIQSVKLSDLIFTQAHTDWDEKKANLKLKDDAPINVFQYEGKMYVIDGHHRVVVHQLLGKKHISANVQS